MFSPLGIHRLLLLLFCSPSISFFRQHLPLHTQHPPASPSLFPKHFHPFLKLHPSFSTLTSFCIPFSTTRARPSLALRKHTKPATSHSSLVSALRCSLFLFPKTPSLTALCSLFPLFYTPPKHPSPRPSKPPYTPRPATLFFLLISHHHERNHALKWHVKSSHIFHSQKSLDLEGEVVGSLHVEQR